MIKKIISIVFILILTSGCVFAANYNQTLAPEVSLAIKKYKSGNYIGCVQDLYPYLVKNQNNERNQLATYYMAMSSVKIGNLISAKMYYKRTKDLNPNNTLGKYAAQGLICIETPAECYKTKNVEEKGTNKNATELDRFINAPYGNGLSSNLNKEIERKKIEKLRKEINSNQELDDYDFKDFRTFYNKKSQAKPKILDGIKIASNSSPTDAEVLNAIKVLNAAGLNNIAKQAETSRNVTSKEEIITKNEVKSEYKPDITREEYQKQIQREMMEAQMAAMAQPNIGALFGEKNNNQNNMMNNNMMNMLPFMMAQQAQNGNSNGQQIMSPDMIQAMMFNSMMPNFNFGLDSNNN